MSEPHDEQRDTAPHSGDQPDTAPHSDDQPAPQKTEHEPGQASRVRIETAGHVIEIEESGASHRDLVPAALALWQLTRFGRAHSGTTSGQYETDNDTYVDDHDGTVGFSL